MKSRLFSKALLLGLGISVAASAQEPDERAKRPRLGVNPGAPQHRSVAPTLPMGVESTRADDWVLDFHGFLLVPLRLGIARRANPREGQADLVVHNPPQIPQDVREFEWTGAIPSTFVQLNFSYGTTLVRGTAIIAARTVNTGAGLFNPPEQLGLTDAFLTFDLTQTLGEVIEFNVGSFTNRYGVMGEYDAGRYGTPVIARTNVIGETITATFDFDGIGVTVEQGFGGGLGTPLGIVPSGWNDFAETDVAPTLVNHLHAGLSYGGLAQLGLHYFYAWANDDRVAGGLLPDGSISVIGADARVTAKQFGHLYVGLAHASMTDATTVSGALELLNARGGPEIIRNYLGANSGGNGSMTTLAGQYDLSVGRLMYPDLEGHGPDILVSLFGMRTEVGSDDRDFDGLVRTKFGLEATYSMMSWLAAGLRYDNVMPDDVFEEQNFQIISPRIIFHTDWNSQDQLMLQYSRFIYGDGVIVKSGFPPQDDPRVNPDENVLVLSANIWW
jgi:hypothetical protein